MVKKEGGQQPAAASPQLHLFIMAGQNTHLEVNWDMYEFNEYGINGFYTADSPVQLLAF